MTVLVCLLAAPTSLVAAQPAMSTLPGITVLGVGQASVPAETATIVMMLGTNAYYKEDPSMMEQASPTPQPSPEEAAAPVIAALVAAGVPETDITLVSNPFTGDYGPGGGPTSFTIVFTMASPTSTGISDVLIAGIDAARAEGLYVNMTSALYGVADCAALERQARQAAIAHAREQATVQAELLDVSLGDVIASRDDAYGPIAYSGVYGGISQLNTCSLGDNADVINVLYSAPAFDPGVEPTVSLSAYIELTFDISPSA
jgi:uncharacterized protein YggE